MTENSDGDPPDGAYVALYADQTNIGEIPVLADPDKAVVAAADYDEVSRPGKCVLSPEMVILACYDGENDDEGFAAIIADQ